MLKNILNLKGVEKLNKKKQQDINGGDAPIGGIGFPCDEGTFRCLCNGFNRGCVPSVNICIVLCQI